MKKEERVFGMSMYDSMESLQKDKIEYFQNRCREAESLLLEIYFQRDSEDPFYGSSVESMISDYFSE